MEKLKNNFTTQEQSLIMLDLGAPVKSADCYYMIINGKIDNQLEVIHDLDAFLDSNEYLKDYFPCWSVGRLMEICKICEPKKDYEQLCEELQYSQNYCVVIISHIIANLPIIDFSKLED